MLIAVFITEMVILHKYVYLFIYLFIAQLKNSSSVCAVLLDSNI